MKQALEARESPQALNAITMTVSKVDAVEKKREVKVQETEDVVDVEDTVEEPKKVSRRQMALLRRLMKTSRPLLMSGMINLLGNISNGGCRGGASILLRLTTAHFGAALWKQQNFYGGY